MDKLKLFVGAALVAGGACLWAFAGSSEPAAAMIAAGGLLLPQPVLSRQGD